MDLLTSIKGIGVTLAAALIVATGGFTYFDNAKQLTRYLGLSITVGNVTKGLDMLQLQQNYTTHVTATFE